jgi:hypothetical protein
MTVLDRSKQMNLIHEDLARAHPSGGQRRWRGTQSSAPAGRLSREADRALAARLALARLMYGGHAR